MTASSRFTLPANLNTQRNYVDGQFVETGKLFNNISPLHGGVLAQVHEADAVLVDKAVKAALAAASTSAGLLPFNSVSVALTL